MTTTSVYVAESFTGVAELPVDHLHPAADNPRSDPGDLTDLAASIRTHGIIEPLVVCANGPHGYTVVAGHRRLAAAVEAGRTTVPCIHRGFFSTAEMVEVMLVENLQRADLDPLDEARAFAKLVDLGLTQRQIAERVSCNQSHVSRRLTLLEADDTTREQLAAGEITVREAEQRARPPKPKPQPAAPVSLTGDLPVADASPQSGKPEAAPTPSYVYVASSWRNPMQPAVCAALAAAGIDHYDFRNPAGGTGFSWRQVKPDDAPPGIAAKGSDWERVDDYLAMINHPTAAAGFDADFAAMQKADTFVLVLPCGKSAHLELGWAVGAGKRTAILLEDPVEPELMYRMVDHLATSVDDLLAWMGVEPTAPDNRADPEPDDLEDAYAETHEEAAELDATVTRIHDDIEWEHPQWLQRTPWPGYRAAKDDKLIDRISKLNDVDQLRHVIAYEHTAKGLGRRDVLAAAVTRLDEIREGL